MEDQGAPQEYQGSPHQVQEELKDHVNQRTRIEVERIRRRIRKQQGRIKVAKGRSRPKLCLFRYSYWQRLWQRQVRTETEHLVLFPSNLIRRYDARGSIGFFHHAWIEYQVFEKTNLLERYTSGFIFAKLSVNKELGNMVEKPNNSCYQNSKNSCNTKHSTVKKWKISLTVRRRSQRTWLTWSNKR